MLEMNKAELVRNTILFNHEIKLLKNKTVSDFLKKSEVVEKLKLS